MGYDLISKYKTNLNEFAGDKHSSLLCKEECVFCYWHQELNE
jgi:hypothetical protein